MSIIKTILKVFFSIILSILGFVFVTAFIALLVLRPTNISEIVTEEIETILEETVFVEIVADFAEMIIEDIHEALLSEHASDYTDFYEDGDFDDFYDINDYANIDALWDFDDFDRDDILVITELLQREDIAAEINRFAGMYIHALTEGNFDFYLTSSDIVDFIESISPELLDEFGIAFTSEDLELVQETIDAHVELSEFRISRVLEEADVDISVPLVFFSSYPLIIFGILTALFIVDSLLLHRKRILPALILIGLPLIFSGLLYAVSGIFFSQYAKALSFLTELSDEFALGFVERIISEVFGLLIIPGLISLALGIILIILFLTIFNKTSSTRPYPRENPDTIVWVSAGLIINIGSLSACVLLTLHLIRSYFYYLIF